MTDTGNEPQQLMIEMSNPAGGSSPMKQKCRFLVVIQNFIWLLVALTLISGCKPKATPNPAIITAAPNPVPAGSGPGVTTVSWDAGQHTNGQVYVAVNQAEEKLFSGQAKGTREAPWINVGAVYEFRLYEASNRAKLLTSVKVTREKE